MSVERREDEGAIEFHARKRKHEALRIDTATKVLVSLIQGNNANIWDHSLSSGGSRPDGILPLWDVGVRESVKRSLQIADVLIEEASK